MSRYATYEKFFDPEQAEPVLGILRDHEIPYEFSSLNKPLDPLITGEGPAYAYEVKIAANQFETANRILREKIQIDLNDIDPDYYLFAFDNNELVEILKELDAFWSTKMKKLAQPAKASSLGKWGGYSLSVGACFIGIVTGLIYWQSTKTLPNGNRYYLYDEETRKLGKNMVYISLILIAISLTVFLARSYALVTW